MMFNESPVSPTSPRSPRRQRVVAWVSNPTRTSEELRSVAQHPSWRVRREVASHRNTPPDLLARFVFDQSSRVRIRLTVNPRVEAQSLTELASDPHRDIRHRVLGHIHAPFPALLVLRKQSDLRHFVDHRVEYQAERDERLAHELSRSDDGELRALAASSPNPQIQLRLSDDSDNQVTDALAASVHLQQDIALRLARGPLSSAQFVLAARSDLAPTVVAALLDQKSVKLRSRVADHCAIPPEWQQHLATYAEPEVRLSLASNPHLSSDAHRILITRTWWQIRAAAFASAHTTAFDVIAGLRSIEPGVQRAAAESAAVAFVPVEQLTQILTFLAPQTLLGLAANAKTPPPVLDLLVYYGFTTSPTGLTLVSTPMRWITGRALGNPSLPATRLAQLPPLEHFPAWIQGQLARNPSLTPDRRDALQTYLVLGGATAGDLHFDPVRGNGHPGDTTQTSAYEAIAQLADAEGSLLHPLDAVRARWAMSRDTLKQDELRVLAQDSSTAVRRVVLRYDPLSQGTINILSADPDEYIRDATLTKEPSKKSAPSTQAVATKPKKERSGIWIVPLIIGFAVLRSCFDSDSRPPQVPFPGITLTTLPRSPQSVWGSYPLVEISSDVATRGVVGIQQDQYVDGAWGVASGPSNTSGDLAAYPSLISGDRALIRVTGAPTSAQSLRVTVEWNDGVGTTFVFDQPLASQIVLANGFVIRVDPTLVRRVTIMTGTSQVTFTPR